MIQSNISEVLLYINNYSTRNRFSFNLYFFPHLNPRKYENTRTSSHFASTSSLACVRKNVKM